MQEGVDLIRIDRSAVMSKDRELVFGILDGVISVG